MITEMVFPAASYASDSCTNTVRQARGDVECGTRLQSVQSSTKLPGGGEVELYLQMQYQSINRGTSVLHTALIAGIIFDR